MGKDQSCSIIQRKAGLTILISEKELDSVQRKLPDIEGDCIMIKKSIHQEAIATLEIKIKRIEKDLKIQNYICRL